MNQVLNELARMRRDDLLRDAGRVDRTGPRMASRSKVRRARRRFPLRPSARLRVTG